MHASFIFINIAVRKSELRTQNSETLFRYIGS